MTPQLVLVEIEVVVDVVDLLVVVEVEIVVIDVQREI